MSCARWVFALLAVAGCSDPQEGFVSFGSARFQYHARADDVTVAPSVLEQLERYGDAADALLGLSPTDHLPIAYYKYRDLRDLQEHGPCDEGNAGCEFQRAQVLEVHSPLSVDEHEHRTGCVGCRWSGRTVASRALGRAKQRRLGAWRRLAYLGAVGAP